MVNGYSFQVSGFRKDGSRETGAVTVTRSKKSSRRTGKRLNYNHREISSQILRAYRARGASSVLARAKSKLSSLRRCQGTGQYDETELSHAVAHARRMVQCASKKLRNLKEEELLEKRLVREQETEQLQSKEEAKRRISNKKELLEKQIITEELLQTRKQEKEYRELLQRKTSHRNQERGKINEADMKYIKGRLDYMREQGYADNSQEILQLKASFDELRLQQLQTESAELSGDAAAGAESAAMPETASGAGLPVGSVVDLSL